MKFIGNLIFIRNKHNSTSALHFEINQRPSNGSCDINPKIGSISTLFIVTCFDWQIEREYLSKSLHCHQYPHLKFDHQYISNHLNLIVHIRDIMNECCQKWSFTKNELKF